MSKKAPARRTKKRDFTLRLAVIVFSSFLLFVAATIFYNLNATEKPLPCANSISCIKDLSGKPELDSEGIFMGKKVTAPGIPETPSFAIANARAVLGDNTEEKHIYVDLTNQRLYAYDGNKLFLDTNVSTGKWGRTPTGDFRIWVWMKATRMSGGNQALGTYYNLPNVPFTMFFANNEISKAAGYSLHGTYWHNSFGQPMSHGCVNMYTPDAEKIFYWSNPAISGWTTYATPENEGPLITIYGTAPYE